MMPTTLPDSNKSLTYTAANTPLHLTYTQLTPPAPSELLIKVHAAAVNPVDLQLWGSNIMKWLSKSEKGVGVDYAGKIATVGDNLKGKWKEGDEVFGLFARFTGDGTFTQYIKVLSSDPIAKKPTIWSYEEAAAVSLVVLTSRACLDWLPPPNGNVGKRRVIVSGASGGVGVWCVQLAKKTFDCHVTGICSGRNADFVRELGADEVVDYTKGDVTKILLDKRPDGRKYDLYIDCVGGVEMLEHWKDLLHSRGAYVTIVGDKTSRLSLGGPMDYLMHPSSIFRFLYGYLVGPRYANLVPGMKSEWLDQVVQLAEKGEVKVVVQEILEGILSERSETWKKVWELMEEGRVRGKVVVKIDH